MSESPGPSQDDITASGMAATDLTKKVRVGYTDAPSHWKTENLADTTPTSDGMDPPMYTWSCTIEKPKPENDPWGWQLSPEDMGAPIPDHEVKVTGLANSPAYATSALFSIDD